MLRIGIVGLDSTHAVEFTRLLNFENSWNTAHPACVVAACAGKATDFPLSVSRRARVLAEVSDLNVPIFPSSAEVVAHVDAVMVLSCDGRSHLADAAPLFHARKPVFIDKPLCADWREAAELLRRARKNRTPCFSASALRFRARPGLGPRGSGPFLLEADVPALQEPGHPALCWHGIHGIEAGYAFLGAGCQSVRRCADHQQDVTMARWPDGSELRVRRRSDERSRDFPLRITSRERAEELGGIDYRWLLRPMLEFFSTGTVPVGEREMVEVLAFAAAADLSQAQDGEEIRLQELMPAGTLTCDT